MILLARIISRFRWPVFAVWIVVLAFGAFYAPKLSQVVHGGGFYLPDSESARADDILRTEFGGQGYQLSIQVVFTHPGWNINQMRFQQAVQTAARRISDLPETTRVFTYYDTRASQMVSPDGTATVAYVSFNGSEEQYVPAIRAALGSGELEAHVTGGPAFDYDLEQTSEQDLITAESYSLPMILLILLFVFGSVIAAGLPLALGAISVSISFGALYLLGHWIDLSIFVRNMVTMMGLGLGIDYSLFMVSRFREELAAGRSDGREVAVTLSTAGKAVTFSGTAVVIGLALMMLFNLVFLRSLGLGGLLVAFASVILAITLLPALLSILGRHVNTARVLPLRFLRPGKRGLWHSWSRLVMRRPIAFLALSLAVMCLLAYAVTGLSSGAPGVDNLSPQSDSRLGFELVAQKWGPGYTSPITIVFHSSQDGSVWSPAFRDNLKQLDNWLKKDPRVAAAQSIAELPLPPVIPNDPFAIAAYAREHPAVAADAASLVNVNNGSNSTQVRVISAVDPLAPAAKQLVEDIRGHLVQSHSFTGWEILVGGGTAQSVDFTNFLARTFPYLLAAILVMTFIVLLLLFRSLLLPLKAIFMNLLSVGAALGVLVLVFQDGWGAGLIGVTPVYGIVPFVPVIMFSVLFGLSMDYEVFLLSRIKEEFEASGDNERSVALGLEKTARTITSAGLIMVAVFGSFALTQSIVVKELGLGLAISIFLDVTIVRIIMVPATMKLLGKWNWWLPEWLKRLLPKIRLKA